MGAPGRPGAGVWGANGRALAIWAAVGASGLAWALAPAAALAQSTEIRKTLAPEHSSGQTEIRKSRPGSAGQERSQDRGNARSNDRAPEGIEPALPETHEEASGQRVAPAVQEPPTDLGSQSATATQAEVTGDTALTRFSLLLSARVRYHVSSLANPYRIVIDMPDVDFRLPVTAGQRGHGLIRAYRYGLFGPGKARVVIDTTQPVRVQKHAMTVRSADKAVRPPSIRRPRTRRASSPTPPSRQRPAARSRTPWRTPIPRR